MNDQVGVWYKKAETLTILWGDAMCHLTPVFPFTFYTFARVLVAPTNPVLKQSIKKQTIPDIHNTFMM